MRSHGQYLTYNPELARRNIVCKEPILFAFRRSIFWYKTKKISLLRAHLKNPNFEYPSAVQIIDLIINIIHFIVLFIINLISAILIIIVSTRQQLAIKKKQTYREILNKQIHQHKNLPIGPCVLIILGIPRLIISFALGCMKTPSDSWLFLMGYFISLISSLLTFILFVLPSSTYKQAFRQVISRYRNIIKRSS